MAMPETEAATPPAPSVAPAPAATVATTEPAPVAAPEKPEVLMPLPADIVEMVNSNSTMSVYEQIYYITNAPFSDSEKVQALMMILPSLNREGQRAVAHSACNYVHDSTHSLVRNPLLEGKLDKQILSVFMTDTLKRPDAIKMPVLTTLAATDGHPMQYEARELLEAFSKSHAPAGQQNAISARQQMAAKTD